MRLKHKVDRHGYLRTEIIQEPNQPTNIPNDFERILSAIGWEMDVYIKKYGAFDKLTDSLDFVEKNDKGFTLYHRNYIYI